MPGAGRLVFTAGQTLTAAQVQDYLQDQAVMNFSGTAARATGIPTPSAGMVSHIGGGTVQVYNGTAWVALGGVPNAVLSNTPTGTYTSGGTSYAYYEFTASGTATVTTAGFADVLIVGGGGSGGIYRGAGGGAGGHVEVSNAYLPSGSLTVTVGAGGAAAVSTADNFGLSGRTGNTSRLGSYYSPGGGGGGGSTIPVTGSSPSVFGQNGASGGGASGFLGGSTAAAGLGISPIGNDGGTAAAAAAGGGGGSSAVGANGSSTTGGNGGAGTSNSYTGSSVTRCGGGGGAGTGTAGTGGSGGGGNASTTTPGANATPNTGSGGGGATNSASATSGAGGSGIVIIRVRT